MSTLSIALCTYNGSRFLREQLDSLASQTRLPDEVVVCDDGSSDCSVKLVEQWAQEVPFSVRIEVNEQNLGFAANFQKALSLCTGDFVFPSDQDDVWNVNKLEKMADVFEKQPEVGLVFCNAKVVDENRNVLIEDFAEYVQPWHRFCIARFVTPFWRVNRMDAGCCSAIRRSVLEQILPIPDGWYHDMWIYATGPLYGSVVTLDEPLIEHRTHGKSVTNQNRGWGKECMTHNFRGAVFLFDLYRPRMDQLRNRLTDLPDSPVKRRYEQYLSQTAAHFERRKRIRKGGFIGYAAWLLELVRGRYFRYNQPWRALTFDLKEGVQNAFNKNK